jgi:hypothetical protein
MQQTALKSVKDKLYKYLVENCELKMVHFFWRTLYIYQQWMVTALPISYYD